jgi:hypothetical protein
MGDRCEVCGRADCRDALPYEDSDLRMLITMMDRDGVASAVAHRWVAAARERDRLRDAQAMVCDVGNAALAELRDECARLRTALAAAEERAATLAEGLAEACDAQQPGRCAVSGVLDRLEALVAERDRTCNIPTLTRNADAIASEVAPLVPLLKEWDDSQDALAIAEEEEGHDEQERAWERVGASERALLAALRTAPAGEAKP